MTWNTMDTSHTQQVYQGTRDVYTYRLNAIEHTNRRKQASLISQRDTRGNINEYIEKLSSLTDEPSEWLRA